MFKINLKIKKNLACPVKLQRNGGMTYVELIVVLSIFAIMSGVVLVNYGSFQAKVDIKNYANDIALRIVQAQKDALSGKFQAGFSVSPDWKPSYGIDFSMTHPNNFIYFADTDYSSNKYYDGYSSEWPVSCPDINVDNECIENTKITKGEISSLQYYIGSSLNRITNGDLFITFTRPSSSVIFSVCDSSGISSCSQLSNSVSLAQITIASTGSNLATACIQVYSSGRVQIGQCLTDSSSLPSGNQN